MPADEFASAMILTVLLKLISVRVRVSARKYAMPSAIKLDVNSSENLAIVSLQSWEEAEIELLIFIDYW